MEPIDGVIEQVLGKFSVKQVGEEVCGGCGQHVRIVEITSAGKLPGGTFKVGCLCREQQIIRDIMAENQQRRLNHIMQAFDDESLIPKSLQNATLENFITETNEQRLELQEARNYVEQFDPKSGGNLLFTGPYGTGKSHLAVGIVKVLMEQRSVSALYIAVPEMITKLKASWSRDSDTSEGEILQALKMVDVLVMDDIGAEYSGRNAAESWAASEIFTVINARMGVHTIYTTNLNGEELQAKLGARNFSRIFEDTKVVKFTGEDYRRRKMRG